MFSSIRIIVGILLNVELLNFVAVSLCIVFIIGIYTFRVITLSG